jgi:hypothetical protein
MRVPQLTFNGRPLDMSADRFGKLRCSNDVLSDSTELRRRMAEDGYLFLAQYLDFALVRAAREELYLRLYKHKALHPEYPPYEGICNPDSQKSFRPILDYRTDGASESVQDCAPLREVLFQGRMLRFFEQLLGGSILCFNHIWFRAKGSGKGKATPPHYDILYMGRGTHNLFTAWVPYVDVGYDMGGLMILENSHRLEWVRNTYGRRDVDVYCKNADDAPLIESGQKLWQKTGEYSLDAIGTQAELGGRWLTTDFRMGDVLVFGPYTMHASTDNQTPRMRISSDTRYQLASEPADERWIGVKPIGHGLSAKRGVIC